MKAPALLPVTEPKSATPPEPARARGPRGPLADEEYDARMRQAIVDRVMRPVQPKPVADFGYGDLIAAARTPAPRPVQAARARRADGDEDAPAHGALVEETKWPVQAKAAVDFGYGDLVAAARALPAHGTAVQRKCDASPRTPDATGMPPSVRAKMEAAFGADFSDVRVHPRSARAVELAALAFTQGSEVHVAPGQWAPETTKGQELLGHELAHVVQQRAGRVQATAQAMGVALNDEPALEREADAMGARAARAPTTHGDGELAAARSGSSTEPGGGRAAVQRLGDTPRTDLAPDMLDVPVFNQTLGGATTAAPSESDPELRAGEVLIKAGRTSFDAQVALKPTITIGAGQTIQVGPTQTLVGSQRTGIYQNPDGSQAAEYTTGPGQQMRDAGPSQRADGRPVPEPFYWEPANVSDASRTATIPFADQPQFVIPATMGRARLTETRGQDSFRTALSAKRDGTIIHLRTFAWNAPWAMRIPENRTATGGDLTGANTTGPGAAPPTLSGPIPNDASHEWMRFTDVATARAAGWQILTRYIGDARTEDRSAFRIMAEALFGLNPTFTISVRCDQEYSSMGSDTVTLTAAGTSNAQTMANVRLHGSATLHFRMFDVFSIDTISSSSSLTISVSVSGVASSMSGSVPWVYPWATSSEVRVPFDDSDHRNAYKLSGSVSEGGEPVTPAAVPPSTGGGGGPSSGDGGKGGAGGT